MGKKTVGSWRRAVLQPGRELADGLEPVNAITLCLLLLMYPNIRGVGLTGRNKVVTYTLMDVDEPSPVTN